MAKNQDGKSTKYTHERTNALRTAIRKHMDAGVETMDRLLTELSIDGFRAPDGSELTADRLAYHVGHRYLPAGAKAKTPVLLNQIAVAEPAVVPVIKKSPDPEPVMMLMPRKKSWWANQSVNRWLGWALVLNFIGLIALLTR